MNLLSIAWKSVQQRRLASLLTALNVALGVTMMVLLLVISGAINGVFNQKSIAYHLIVGARGSDLQLVLSSVFRVEPPIANLPYMYLEDLRKSSQVDVAIPLGFGDFTKPQHGSFPIVGTTEAYFANEYTPGHKFQVVQQPETRRLTEVHDAVIGSYVASTNGWKAGDQFSIVHGGADSETVHDENFTIVAVLRQTGTPNDRSVFLNLEAVYTLDGHQKPVDEVEARLRDFYGDNLDRLQTALAQLDDVRARRAKGQEIGDPKMGYGLDTPDAMKEITAIYVRMKSDLSAFSLHSKLKRGSKAMAVNPIQPIKKLMDNILGNIEKILVVLTAMIIAVSGIS